MIYVTLLYATIYILRKNEEGLRRARHAVPLQDHASIEPVAARRAVPIMRISWNKKMPRTKM